MLNLILRLFELLYIYPSRTVVPLHRTSWKIYPKFFKFSVCNLYQCFPPSPSLSFMAYYYHVDGFAQFEENRSVAELRKYFDWLVQQCETIWWCLTSESYKEICQGAIKWSEPLERCFFCTVTCHAFQLIRDEYMHLLRAIRFIFVLIRDVFTRMKRKQIIKTTIIHNLCLFKALFLSISKPSPWELNHDIWTPR